MKLCVAAINLRFFCRRYYNHNKSEVLDVVQNPDRHPDYVVDLRLVSKVEAGEKNGKSCVSMTFTTKLKKSGESVSRSLNLNFIEVYGASLITFALPFAGIAHGIQCCCGACWSS